MAARGYLKFARDLKELRIHLCQTSEASKGVREFIEQHYVGLKKANPRFPILVRECRGVQPRLYARYEAMCFHCRPKELTMEALGFWNMFSEIKKSWKGEFCSADEHEAQRRPQAGGDSITVTLRLNVKMLVITTLCIVYIKI